MCLEKQWTREVLREEQRMKPMRVPRYGNQIAAHAIRSRTDTSTETMKPERINTICYYYYYFFFFPLHPSSISTCK